MASGSDLAEKSPFLPDGFGRPAAASPAPEARLEGLELTGITFLGGQELFSIQDTVSKRSYWIPLNGSEEGVSVQSYDRATESVVLSRGGLTARATLKESVPLAMAVQQAPAAPAAAVVRGGPPQMRRGAAVPQENEESREARMLVSDLLEIQVAERERMRAEREQTGGEGAGGRVWGRGPDGQMQGLPGQGRGNWQRGGPRGERSERDPRP
jgi:hypothetical protein